MTAKEYLRTLRWTELSIETRKDELRRLDAEYTYLSGISYDRDRVQTSPSGDAFPQSDRRIDLAIKIREDILAMQKLRTDIIGKITGLDNPLYSQVLLECYVNYLSFDDIAHKMHYSYVRITHIHGEALQEFTHKYLNVDNF